MAFYRFIIDLLRERFLLTNPNPAKSSKEKLWLIPVLCGLGLIAICTELYVFSRLSVPEPKSNLVNNRVTVSDAGAITHVDKVEETAEDSGDIESNSPILTGYFVCSTYKIGEVVSGLDVGKTETVCVENMTGDSAGGNATFKQSFVPRCTVIKAVQLATYPVGGGSGWLQVEITGSQDNAPSKPLARAFVHIDGNCPIPHGGLMLFPMGQINVDPDKRYWITSSEHRDNANQGAVTNFGISRNEQYSDGRLVYGDSTWDAKFRVLGEYLPPTWLKKISQEEFQTLTEQEETID